MVREDAQKIYIASQGKKVWSELLDIQGTATWKEMMKNGEEKTFKPTLKMGTGFGAVSFLIYTWAHIKSSTYDWQAIVLEIQFLKTENISMG